MFPPEIDRPVFNGVFNLKRELMFHVLMVIHLNHYALIKIDTDLI